MNIKRIKTTSNLKLFNWLKENFEVPENVTGFVITASFNDLLRITWETLATEKENKDGSH